MSDYLETQVTALQQRVNRIEGDALAELDKLRAEAKGLRSDNAGLRAHLVDARAERDEARGELVKALQTIELNAATGPCLNVDANACYCAACGRMRGPNRGWKFVVADVSTIHRFSIRVAFCRRCFDALDARAAKHIPKEQLEHPGELEEGDRG